MSLLCCLFVSGGLAYMLPHPTPQSHGFEYWRYDVSQIVNPYGTLEAGWSKDYGRFTLEMGLRHDSSIRVGDFGQNTAEVRVRWYPFR